MDYYNLLYEYNKLKEENERLKADNLSLRECLQNNKVISTSNIASTEENILSNAGVNQNSTASRKVELFMSYFRGRPHVYAKRFENQKKGTAGYSPVCGNEWRRGVCRKPKVNVPLAITRILSL